MSAAPTPVQVQPHVTCPHRGVIEVQTHTEGLFYIKYGTVLKLKGALEGWRCFLTLITGRRLKIRVNTKDERFRKLKVEQTDGFC